MSRPLQLLLSGGESKVFSIAGLKARFTNEIDESRPFSLPSSYRSFVTSSRDNDLEIRIGCCRDLPLLRASLLYDSQLHWRVLSGDGAFHFELVHPPTALLYCRMSVRPDFSTAEVWFAEGAYREFVPAGREQWDLPYPLDQLLLVPALALRGSVLLHASGAVLPAGAHVFAGHSGDGKSTLSGLLAREGVPLLSDERVALQKTESGFVAHGTPWPGDGDVVSNASERLRALFILRKASSHSIASAENASLAPELIARAIVPYYLPDVASRILGLFADLSEQVPVRELRFARQPGLRSVLQAA